jgi:hypothetical protein
MQCAKLKVPDGWVCKQGELVESSRVLKWKVADDAWDAGLVNDAGRLLPGFAEDRLY